MPGPGDSIGETALIQDVPRTATVAAQTGLRCLATSAWDFRPLLEKETPLARRLNGTASRRARVRA